MSQRIVIAIDGPAGSGKSTAAKQLARRLGYRLLDTGALYRAVALVARERGVAWDDEPGCAAVAAALEVDFRFDGDENRVLVAGRDVTGEVRAPEISQGASKVSALPAVRAALLDLQRRLGQQGGVVAEGRDIGTVVFPNADAKFFLTASPTVRAARRTRELRAAGQVVDEEKTLAEMLERDQRDASRATAPLRQAADAVLLDTSDLGIEDMVTRMLDEVGRRPLSG